MDNFYFICLLLKLDVILICMCMLCEFMIKGARRMKLLSVKSSLIYSG